MQWEVAEGLKRDKYDPNCLEENIIQTHLWEIEVRSRKIAPELLGEVDGRDDHGLPW